jgi:hypothetical protein
LAFRRLEEIADVPDLLPEGIDGPDGFCAEMGFKLCEGHFDWIEVRASTVGQDWEGLPRTATLVPLAFRGNLIRE